MWILTSGEPTDPTSILTNLTSAAAAAGIMWLWIRQMQGQLFRAEASRDEANAARIKDKEEMLSLLVQVLPQQTTLLHRGADALSQAAERTRSPGLLDASQVVLLLRDLQDKLTQMDEEQRRR